MTRRIKSGGAAFDAISVSPCHSFGTLQSSMSSGRSVAVSIPKSTIISDTGYRQWGNLLADGEASVLHRGEKAGADSTSMFVYNR
jgi:hypothetical protein